MCRFINAAFYHHWMTAIPVTKLLTLGAAMYYLLSSDYEELELDVLITTCFGLVKIDL